ncbi:MAG: GTP cyclohydrolase [Leptotrichiaceae bacterium]|nr:GTP cyclohydrolase [Leptotrichiaceae bacterium]MBP6281504.1 GTP cyclohydrolase [Leptotrichiaceae bacterium]MBP7100832.1 GTP cyclohydrolase [Leptotrichiaceae bacterium]MBP7725466.1 GTP cyclohydrolase [Leptotrichiaceae bacterium]MBP9628883.1 GTP cyclohydrolase [Leptotrichiaceae bacterium]
MFIVILNYIKSLDEVDEKRNEHLSFINNYVLKGKFLAVGRQTPPKGGVVIAHNVNRKELENILINDPYYTNKLAEHSIIEFNPKMYANGLEEFLDNLK